ncbi:MAG: PHP domain-containing protein [Acidimicrobiales bacterium]
MIDLHTHSRVSDGSETPARVVELAAAAGCSAVALTDHDSLSGLSEARAAAESAGITLVAGCEVSCRKPVLGDGSRPPGSMHVLCYFVDGDAGPLPRELHHLRGDRRARNLALVERLRSMGLDVHWHDVVAEAGSEQGVGRPHFARLLVKIGAALDVDDAFDRWLADGRPGYVPKGRLDAADVVGLARDSGGVAVVAHPLSLGLDAGPLERVLSGLAERGLAGIEAVYGNYRPDERAALARLARRLGLVATGGSDFHGTFKPGLAVGTGRGDLYVDDGVLEELASRRPAV